MAATQVAASPPATISVYASLPLKVVRGAALDLSASNWGWVESLTVSVGRLEILHFSERPLKWIRYAIGALIGARGGLYTGTDLTNILDYDGGLPAESVSYYYHTSNEERLRMFPIDPHILRTHLTSTGATPRRPSFRDDVAARDGEQCVWLGDDLRFCDAVHLLAHSKGDQYISTLTHRRGRGNEAIIITQVDDTRNGLLLSKTAHVTLGDEVAVLKTPNFAMSTRDVDPNASPEETRYTAHIIKRLPNLPSNFISGSQLRIADSPQSPPDILFDVVYASFVLLHFGTDNVRQGFTNEWEHSFYIDRPMAAVQSSSNALADERAAATKRKRDQAQACEARYSKRRERHLPDAMDMVLGFPYILLSSTEQQEMMRAAREGVEEAEPTPAEQKLLQEKVEGWIRQVDAA